MSEDTRKAVEEILRDIQTTQYPHSGIDARLKEALKLVEKPLEQGESQQVAA